MPDTPRVLVSGNCQTAGLAAELLRIGAAREAHALPLTNEAPDVLRSKLDALVPGTDLWLLSPNNKVGRAAAEAHGKRGGSSPGPANAATTSATRTS